MREENPLGELTGSVGHWRIGTGELFVLTNIYFCATNAAWLLVP